MADEVWPLEPDERVRLSSFNGIGFDLKGFTRKDPTGRCFATRYFTFVYLPVVPLDRFYLEEGPIQYQDLGLSSNTLTRYRITGWSRLRVGEILRTYLFSWIIGPGVVLVPILLWLGQADQLSDRIGIGWVIGGFVAWLLGSIIGLAFLHTAYRERWAPLRQAVVHDD
ncbi:hypothetical protein ACQPXM_07445 [Kribbella sp. CA-253562]|uniref:hypothetical protein n=1 Tax=Kribbella sp. CA-253562 TaxID=3239942 RepID=UPI003D90E037